MFNWGYLTEKDYVTKLKKIKARNASRERKRKLKEEKRKSGFRFKLPSTTKLVLIGIGLLCLEIVVFCQWVMVELRDVSAMYVLIGIPAALIPIIWAYFSKSKAENTVGGIVYESAMREKEKKKEETQEDLSGIEEVIYDDSEDANG